MKSAILSIITVFRIGYPFSLQWTINPTEWEKHTKPLSVSVFFEPTTIRYYKILYAAIIMYHYGKPKDCTEKNKLMNNFIVAVVERILMPILVLTKL